MSCPVKSTLAVKPDSNPVNPVATESFSCNQIKWTTVLYAEDDKLLRECSIRMLTRAGYTVKSVENGIEAWEALNATPFDLLITDNDMPELTGVELVTKLRLKGMNLPIILASGSADFFSGEE